MKELRKDVVKALITKPDQIEFLYAITAGLRRYDEYMEQSTTEEEKDEVRASVWEYKRWLWSVLENIVPVYTKKLIVYPDQTTTDTDLDYFLKLLEGFGVRIIRKPAREEKPYSFYEEFVVSKNYDGWS